jgi:hypothetical protein
MTSIGGTSRGAPAKPSRIAAAAEHGSHQPPAPTRSARKPRFAAACDRARPRSHAKLSGARKSQVSGGATSDSMREYSARSCAARSAILSAVVPYLFFKAKGWF